MTFAAPMMSTTRTVLVLLSTFALGVGGGAVGGAAVSSAILGGSGGSAASGSGGNGGNGGAGGPLLGNGGDGGDGGVGGAGGTSGGGAGGNGGAGGEGAIGGNGGAGGFFFGNGGAGGSGGAGQVGPQGNPGVPGGVGPRGPQGERGPVGPAGPAGAGAQSHTVTVFEPEITIDHGPRVWEITSLADVPVGTWLFTAQFRGLGKWNAGGPAISGVDVDCYLIAPGASDPEASPVDQASVAGSAASVTDVIELGEPTTVTAACLLDDVLIPFPEDVYSFDTVSLTAIKVQ